MVSVNAAQCCGRAVAPVALPARMAGVLERHRGEDHRLTLEARGALAELYTASGRPEEAARYSTR
jgi:hypothetical protein